MEKIINFIQDTFLKNVILIDYTSDCKKRRKKSGVILPYYKIVGV